MTSIPQSAQSKPELAAPPGAVSTTQPDLGANQEGDPKQHLLATKTEGSGRETSLHEVVFGPIDPDSLAILQLIDGDPIHKRDRAHIVQAIFAEADAACGMVDPNKVRERLHRSVFPQVIGPVYSALSRAGVLTVDGWTINEDHAGRNYGKPCRTYKLNRGAQE